MNEDLIARQKYEELKKEREKFEQNALQSNIALMGRFLGGGVDRYGRQIPMNTQGALGVGLGHVLGGALWRWLNRDKSMFNKTKANGEPIGIDDTSPEAGWENQSQPTTIWQKGIQDWENAKYDIVNRFAQQNYKEPNNLLPIGNFADNAVKPNYNLEDEWKGGILSGLGRF